jgi:hypothetical protein
MKKIMRNKKKNDERNMKEIMRNKKMMKET